MTTTDPSPPDALIERFRAEQRAVRAEALAGRGGVALARRLSDACDELLARCFREAVAGAPAATVSLLAVGGYARGTLALGSDLDVVLLATDPEHPAVARVAERLLHPLWDARVTVGHAVRSVDDFVALARTDVRTATTVLDARLVAGDAALAHDAVARCSRAAFEGDLDRFLDGLVDEMAARHKRYGATVYLLEPDVKHSRGGLRDLDIARWALRARFRAGGLDDALRAGAVSQVERDALAEAQEFLWRVRCALHARTGRRSDRLSFDEQEEMANRLGWVDPAVEAEDPVRALGEATEKMMSLWYRHARAVATTTEHVIARCRPARSSSEHLPRTDRITDEIARFDGALCFTSPGALRRDPSLALRILELAALRRAPLASGTRAAIAAHAQDPAWCQSLRAHEGASAAFLRLLSTSAKAVAAHGRSAVSGTETNEGSVLAELHDLGLLLAVIPEFAHVTGRVQHDIYHVYTVDVHSVASVDRLHAIARGDLAEEFPLPASLLAGTDRMEILLLATLLHDVGKSRGGSHARIGAEMAVLIATRLGFAPRDAEAVSWLVLEHLTLYHAATRRDLGDPATLSALVETVRDSWRLRALYLLTVADLSTTSPTAMTSWKARMLDELYLRVDEALTAGAPALDARAETLRTQALTYAADGDRAAVERLLARMPPRYLAATSPEAIVRHARALDAAPAGARRVHAARLEGDMTGELWEVLFTAPDRPGLLSLFAAVLYANRLDVQGAQIYSSGGDAVDVFVVRSPNTDAVAVGRIVAGLSGQLDTLLDGRADPDALVAAARGGAGLPRPEPAVRSEVRMHDAASAAATVVEVFGRDRPGFLYRVARALHGAGLGISLAKVNTEGRRAADVFYVTEGTGRKLPPERFDAVRGAILDAVEGSGIVAP